MTELLYQLEDLSFQYSIGKEKVNALSHITLSIPSGEFVSLSGPSGSGKSTLLNLLGFVEPLQSGKMSFCGKPCHSLNEKEKNHIRRFDIGFIFQSFHLLEVLTAEENVAYFLARQGVSASERKVRSLEALRSVGLLEHCNKKPLEMSGGQRQRVAVARALAKNPRVLLADEPTANLDQETGKELLKLMRNLVDTKGVSIMISSHEPMVQKFSSRQIQLIDGAISLVHSVVTQFSDRHQE